MKAGVTRTYTHEESGAPEGAVFPPRYWGTVKLTESPAGRSDCNRGGCQLATRFLGAHLHIAADES